MGTSSSQHSNLASNEFLLRLAGQDSIAPNHAFWNKFLSFSLGPPLNSVDQCNLDEEIRPCCELFLVNNLRTGNFGSLLQVFLERTAELLACVETDKDLRVTECFSNTFCWQTYNALFVIRCFTKYIVENLKDEEVIRQFEARPSPGGVPPEEGDPGVSRLDSFLDALIEIIVDIPLKDVTYALHLESVNTLIVLLSGKLFTAQPAEKLHIYRSLMQGRYSIHSPLLVKTLLQHFISRPKAPPSILGHQSGEGSLVFGLASGLWNVVTLGYGRTEQPEKSTNVLGNQSLLLVLILANHCTTGRNPYRQALFSFTGSTTEGVSATPTSAASTFKLDMGALYQALCLEPSKDETTLLLYMLLHRNQNFRIYVISRSNIEQLLVPVLRTLYDTPDSNSRHIYMSLIVILILSEDDLLTKTVHDTILRGITWYTERSISEISLGGLLILIIIRSIQYNMLKMRDKYLHLNCLAALANMSGQFRNLHPYVCQRLISLFETLARKYIRMEMECSRVDEEKVDPSGEASDLAQDVSVMQEVLRMILEIINSSLSNQVQHNPNLVYTLLYKKQVFDPFRGHHAFEDIIHNIDMVINFFSKRLEQYGSNLSEAEVLADIQMGMLQWPRDKLKKFPDLKYKYVEEAQPEEFFIPYVWTLVINNSRLYWDASKLKMAMPDVGNPMVC